MNIDKNKMEELSRKLSSVFIKFPDIQKSEVNIYVFDAVVYFADSGGSSVQYPLQVTTVKVTAETQAPGGEILNDHVIWFCKDVSLLPELKKMIADTEDTAKNLTELTRKNAVSEPYCGPVLFEGQAAAEVFLQMFFCNADGLVSVRQPVVGSEQILQFASNMIKENTLEAMTGKKIISRDITIEALPALEKFENTPLIGSYQVDAEGVKAPEKLTLVEKGVLRNLLSNRVPTLKCKESNGHARPSLVNGGIKAVRGPGVIKMYNTNAETTVDNKKIKEMLLSAAKEEDLEYAYIVRKIVSDAADIQSGNNSFGNEDSKKDLTKTIQVYRVNVSDGSEELISFAEVQGLSIKSFKRLLATSSEMQAYNTMVKPVNKQLYSWRFKLTGIPASFILPQALLFEELDVVKEKQGLIKNKPIVANPVGLKK